MKPGWQTSELWGTASASSALLYFAAESSEWQVKAVGLVCAAAVTIAYALSRGKAKGSAQ